MKKKLVCFLLIVLFIVPIISACKKEDVKSTSTASGFGTPEEAIGLEHKNFGGKTINILTVDDSSGNSYYNCEFAAAELTGNVINDASFNRTQKLKDDYGINLKVTYTKSPVNDYKSQIQAGSNDEQIIADAILNLATLGTSNLLRDFRSVPNFDYKKSWWDQSAVNDLTTANYLFYITGDILVNDKNATWVCYFNKDMQKNNNLDDPYQLVKDGKWTIDKLYTMAKTINTSGQELSDISTGIYGFVTQTYDAIASMGSFNQKMISKDSEDYPKLNIANEENYNKFDKLFNVMTDKSTSIIAESVNSQEKYKETENIFLSGRGLFMYHKVGFVQKIQDANAKFDFGILPLPKYDENQDNYYSSCTVYFSEFLSIPISVPQEDLEAIGYTLQVMGYYGQKLLKPAYYDITLKSQKVNSEQDEDMLDIIFAHRIYDLAAVYDFDGALYMYSGIVGSYSNTLTSTVESRSESIQAAIDKIIGEFKNIEQ